MDRSLSRRMRQGGLGAYAQPHSLSRYHLLRGNRRTGLCRHGSVFRHEGRRIGKRSEEHTSELQAIMSISYDVFCLKKKKKLKEKSQINKSNEQQNKNKIKLKKIRRLM